MGFVGVNGEAVIGVADQGQALAAQVRCGAGRVLHLEDEVVDAFHVAGMGGDGRSFRRAFHRFEHGIAHGEGGASGIGQVTRADFAPFQLSGKQVAGFLQRRGTHAHGLQAFDSQRMGIAPFCR